MQNRRLIGISLHFQNQLPATAGGELNGQRRVVERQNGLAERRAEQLMLAIRAALHYYRLRLGLVEIDQVNDRPGVPKLGKQYGDVVGHAGSLLLRVEIAEP